MLNFNFAEKFSKAPGPRYRRLGKYSGEEFREDYLEKWFKKGTEVTLDANGVFLSFGPSFLSESFGKIAENIGEEEFYKIIHFKEDSDINKLFKRKVQEHVKRAIEKKANS